MKVLNQLFTLALLFFLLLNCPTTSFGQGTESLLLGNWQSDDDIPSSPFGYYNDVWGIVVNGKEYAAIGSTLGVHFISLDEANSPQEVAFVAGAEQGGFVAHRDYHSYQNYLYTVADEGNSSLQIIDFSGLPESVEVVYDSNEFFQRSHNIFIDEENARLYTTNNGIMVFDLTNPEQPTLLDVLSSNPFSIPNGIHDIFAKDNILYINGGNTGFLVVDYNDVDNPILLGTMYNYPNQGYNHAGWLSEDGEHYFLCDETGGADVKTVTVSDFTDMEVIDRFKTDNDNPGHIAHNAIVKGDLLYVSYYSDGLQVFNISDPANVKRAWHYDTYPGKNDSGFKGAWGIYALLPSGRILISDLQTGLYLLGVPEAKAFYSFNESVSTCSEEELDFEIFVGDGFGAGGVNLDISGLPAGATAVFSENPVASNTSVEVKISNWTEGGNFDVMITGTDNVNDMVATSVAIDFRVATSFALVEPLNATIDLPVTTTFEWTMEDWQNEHLLEISISPSFGFGTISQVVTGSSYTLTSAQALNANFTYYWRVTALDEFCGDVLSTVQNFTTAMTVGFEELNESKLNLFPNPANDFVIIDCDNQCSGTFDIQLTDIEGKQVGHWLETADQGKVVLKMKSELSGLYFFRISNGEWTQTRKMIFE